jgi:hypothetical protein
MHHPRPAQSSRTGPGRPPGSSGARRTRGVAGAVVGALLAGLPVLGWTLLHPPEWEATVVLQVDDVDRAQTGLFGTAEAAEGTGVPDGRRAPGVSTGFAMGGPPAHAPMVSLLHGLRDRELLGEVVDLEGLRIRIEPAGFPVELLGTLRMTAVTGGADTLVLRLDEEGAALGRVGSARGGTRGSWGERVEEGGLSLELPPREEALARIRDAGILLPVELTLFILERDRAVQWVHDRLGARIRDGTPFVDVSFRSRDPELGRRIVDRVADRFQDRVREQAIRSAEARSTLLSAQLAEVDSLLSDSRDRLARYRAQSGRSNQVAWAAAWQAREDQVQSRARELRSERDRIARHLEDAEGGVAVLISDPVLAAHPALRPLVTTLVDLQARRDALLSPPGALQPGHPDIVSLELRMAGVTGRLEAAARGQAESLSARLEALEAMGRARDGALAALPGTVLDESRLLAEVESLERLSDRIRTGLREVEGLVALSDGPLRVLDRALPPEPPGRTRNALLLVLFVAGGAVAGGRTGRVLVGAGRALDGVGTLPPPIRMPLCRDELPSVTSPGSRSSEAYHWIEARLHAAGVLPGVLVVTSAAPGEGKTVTAANLAVTLARRGMKVVVVDADLRRPRLSPGTPPGPSPCA